MAEGKQHCFVYFLLSRKAATKKRPVKFQVVIVTAKMICEGIIGSDDELSLAGVVGATLGGDLESVHRI